MPLDLPSLLSKGLACLEERYQPAPVSLDLFANLLRVFLDSSPSRRDLPAALCLSKRALQTRLATAIRRGWLRDTQSKLELTETGRQISVLAADRLLRAHGSWNAAPLHSSLAQLVAQFPLEHPHYPAGYGLVDASITGGHGRDWKPVPRTGAGQVSSLPLSALLSQAIVAFSLHYEEHSPVAFPLAARILFETPDEGRSKDVPVSAAHLSALQRHGFTSFSKNLLFLTTKGRAVRESHRSLVAQIESRWRAKFGDALIADLYNQLRETP